jgi:hypothetical protein
VRLRLKGSKNNSYTVTLNFVTIGEFSGVDSPPQEAPAALIFRRGDANSNGSVDIGDAMFIGQYLAGVRGLGSTSSTVNPVNVASVRQDDTDGDKITITDALYIGQMLAGLRDASFIPVS